MDFSLKKVIFIIIFVFLAANVVILDIIISRSDDTTTQVKSQQEDTEKQENTSQKCNDDCRNYTDIQIQRLEEKIVPQASQSNTIEEIYIPLGSGTTQAEDWQTVSGIQAQVDSNKYPNIEKATFEVSVNIPNGNQQVWVQLYDATNNHPVWFSDVTYQGGTTAQLTSNPISLSSGNITYQARAKTQLQDTVEITSARIHLILQ